MLSLNHKKWYLSIGLVFILSVLFVLGWRLLQPSPGQGVISGELSDRAQSFVSSQAEHDQRYQALIATDSGSTSIKNIENDCIVFQSPFLLRNIRLEKKDAWCSVTAGVGSFYGNVTITVTRNPSLRDLSEDTGVQLRLRESETYTPVFLEAESKNTKAFHDEHELTVFWLQPGKYLTISFHDLPRWDDQRAKDMVLLMQALEHE